jgi:toxin ParE1/3/4
MKLVPSQRFRAELWREFRRVWDQNPQAALRMRDRIVTSVLRLKQFPDSGRSWRVSGCREVVVHGFPYIVIYRASGDTVELLTVFHTSRETAHVH